MRRTATIMTAILPVAILVLIARAIPAQTLSQPLPEEINCRVLEAMSSRQFKIRFVVFRYQSPSDRARLGSLLRKYDGTAVRFESRDSQWHVATLLRMRSCFGRGLLVFPISEAQLAEKDEFLLRFPTSPAKQ